MPVRQYERTVTSEVIRVYGSDLLELQAAVNLALQEGATEWVLDGGAIEFVIAMGTSEVG